MCSTTSDAWTLPTAGWAQKGPWASEETPAPAGTWTAALDYPEETLAHRNCEIIKVFKPLNWCQFVAQQSTTLQINALITTDTQELWAFWFLMGEFTKAMTWTKVLWDKWGQTQSLNRSKMDENIKGSFSTRLNNHVKVWEACCMTMWLTNCFIHGPQDMFRKRSHTADVRLSASEQCLVGQMALTLGSQATPDSIGLEREIQECGPSMAISHISTCKTSTNTH